MNNTYFITYNDGIHGNELWKTDGTEDGTVMVKDINESAGGSFIYQYAPYKNIFFFTATDATHGRELWKSNGTEAGTAMVKDINPTGNGMK